MQIQDIKVNTAGRGDLIDYFQVIKPRETGLLVFIGAVTTIVAAESFIWWRIIFALVTILVASAGANALTNYLDRDLDAQMERTRSRSLPSGRIYPPERALIFAATLSLVGLILAWYLHPYAFLADLIGTLAAVVYRKKVTCVFPQGVIASCAPILMGWFSVRSSADLELLMLCILIMAWLPSHIWSIMMANQKDYYNAGIVFFPISSPARIVCRTLVIFCLLLYASSIGLYFVGHFGWLYLAAVNAAGSLIVFASIKLTLSTDSRDAWKLYKLSAFPYLGFIFLIMSLDIWLRV